MEQLALLKTRLNDLLKAYKQLQRSEAALMQALEEEKQRSQKLMDQVQLTNKQLLAIQLQQSHQDSAARELIYQQLQYTITAVEKVLEDLEA